MNIELIDKLRKRNSQAQHSLYMKYSKMMFLLVLRYINDEDEAKSLTNQAFYKIFNNIGQFEDGNEVNLVAWMKKIAMNEVLMQIRKDKRLHFTENESEIETVSEHQADRELVAEDYYRLIKSLPDGYRLVFNLFAIEGYNHKEIAVKLNIKESTSRSQLAHARSYLKKMISEQF